MPERGLRPISFKLRSVPTLRESQDYRFWARQMETYFTVEESWQFIDDSSFSRRMDEDR